MLFHINGDKSLKHSPSNTSQYCRPDKATAVCCHVALMLIEWSSLFLLLHNFHPLNLFIYLFFFLPLLVFFKFLPFNYFPVTRFLFFTLGKIFPLLVFSLLRYSLLVTALLVLVTPLFIEFKLFYQSRHLLTSHSSHKLFGRWFSLPSTANYPVPSVQMVESVRKEKGSWKKKGGETGDKYKCKDKM